MERRAQELLLLLTHHIKRKAQRLLSDEVDPDLPADSPSTEPLYERLPIEQLHQAYQLSALELAALLCLLAAEVEPYLRTLVRAHQRLGGRPWLELGTIAEMLELDPRAVPELAELFLPSGKLRWGGLALVDEPAPGWATLGEGESPLVQLRVKASRRVVRYCCGDTELPRGLSLRSPPEARLAESLVPTVEKAALLARLRGPLAPGEAPPVIALSGELGVGRKFLAEGLAHEVERPLLVADAGAWDRKQLADHVADVVRESTLTGALVYLDGVDQLLVDDAPTRRAAPTLNGAPAPDDDPPPDDSADTRARRPIPVEIARLLERRTGPIFLGAADRLGAIEALALPVVHLPVRFPSPEQRALLWRRAIERAGGTIAAAGATPSTGGPGEGDAPGHGEPSSPANASARAHPPCDLDGLARRYALAPARIEAAARQAVSAARRRLLSRAPLADGAHVPVDEADLLDASRRQIEHSLSSLAVRTTKAHRWSDLVVPVEVYEGLRELLSYVRHAAAVYETQGFAARHSVTMGLSALFAGPPGTGKTMSASVVARELGMELFRVDLSRVVSKWIGETEKNLGRIFDEAERSHAVILFDEADSLFAKRTEVSSSIDRYANLEVAYLLQRMEQFSGVTILTTNFEDTLDPAFKRRITFKLRFERPDASARAALWRKMFPTEARLADDVDFDEVGRRFDLSGGSIRNAVVRAAFLAAAAGSPIRQVHLLTAAEREARDMGSLVPGEAAAPADETRPPPPSPSRPAPSRFPVTRPRR